MPPSQYESIEITDLEASLRPPGTHAIVLVSGQAWHPKLTPYRLLSILLPVCLGTIKAVALQQGKQNEPITLEWISGVVVFILLFNTGTYERRPIHHIPGYLAWMFKYDCMSAVWWLSTIVSQQQLPRPRYISDEAEVEEHGTIYMVTWYRLLVCATVVTFGMLKAALTYSGISTGATWVEWILGVVISSALYIIGLYESNTIGLWASFFGTDRAYVVRHGLIGTFQLLGVLFIVSIMSSMLFIKRPYKYPYADAQSGTQLPLIPPTGTQSLPWDKTLLEGVYLGSFFAGAFMMIKMLGFIRRYSGDDVRVPLRIRVFALWIASFPSYAFTSPTSSRSHSSTSALARLGAAIWYLTYAFRHLLYFLGALFLIIRAHSFSRGPTHHITAEDLLSMDAGLQVGQFYVYTSQGAIWTIVVVPAGVVILWSLGEVLKSARGVYMERTALIRKGRVKAREQVQKIKGKVQREAVRAILGLSGLSRVDEIHYSFRELVWTLHGDGA